MTVCFKNKTQCTVLFPQVRGPPVSYPFYLTLFRVSAALSRLENNEETADLLEDEN
jgi:hypothetical protein